MKTRLLPLLISACSDGAGPILDREDAGSALPPDVAVYVFGPLADSFVRSGAGDRTNFGLEDRLAADLDDRGEQSEVLLRFPIPEVDAIETARLRVYAEDGSEKGAEFWQFADITWRELEVTWSDRPEVGGPLLETLGRFGEDAWLEVDVTAAARRSLRAREPLSLAIRALSGDGFVVRSREADDRWPELVLGLREGDPPPAGGPPPPPEDAGVPEKDASAPDAYAPDAEPDAGAPVPDEDAGVSFDAEVPTIDPILAGAGDIGDCDSTGDEATASLLDAIFDGGAEGLVFAAGDNAYPDGTAADFNDCFDASGWGRHKARIRPAAGNHEYHTAGAADYYAYFGATAGDPAEGWYSYDLGAWHVIVLNSNCDEVGGCEPGSPQMTWLESDLLAHPTACAVAYWHHPRFSSGSHGDSAFMAPIWAMLYDAGVDVVLQGHDHDYERFVPLDGAGSPDPVNGIRSFVVGTGGRSPRAISAGPNSEVVAEQWGILELTLHPTSYDWEFIPTAGGTFTDAGSSSCH